MHINMVFGTAKCVLFIEVSSFHGVGGSTVFLPHAHCMCAGGPAVAGGGGGSVRG